MTQATPGARALRGPAPQSGPDRFRTLDREAFDVIVVGAGTGGDESMVQANQHGQEVSMITSMAFTVYPVRDMARSRSFYENVLGLVVSSDFGNQWVEYDVGGATFAITTTDMGHAPGAKGAVVAFETADLDAFVKALKEKSVSFVVETFSTPVCRMAVIQDPDENHITIHKRR